MDGYQREGRGPSVCPESPRHRDTESNQIAIINLRRCLNTNVSLYRIGLSIATYRINTKNATWRQVEAEKRSGTIFSISIDHVCSSL